MVSLACQNLAEIRPELKGYSIGLLTMYITYTVGTAVSPMLQSLNWETLQSGRFNMYLCIMY